MGATFAPDYSYLSMGLILITLCITNAILMMFLSYGKAPKGNWIRSISMTMAQLTLVTSVWNVTLIRYIFQTHNGYEFFIIRSTLPSMSNRQIAFFTHQAYHPDLKRGLPYSQFLRICTQNQDFFLLNQINKLYSNLLILRIDSITLIIFTSWPPWIIPFNGFVCKYL